MLGKQYEPNLESSSEGMYYLLMTLLATSKVEWLAD